MGAGGLARPVAAVAALTALLLLWPTAATRAFDPSALWNLRRLLRGGV